MGIMRRPYLVFLWAFESRSLIEVVLSYGPWTKLNEAVPKTQSSL